MFSETRRASGIEELDGKHKLYSSGQHGVATGVAILVHERHVTSVSNWKPYSDKVCALNMKLGKCCLRFVAVYLPHAGYSHDLFFFKSSA